MSQNRTRPPAEPADAVAPSGTRSPEWEEPVTELPEAVAEHLRYNTVLSGVRAAG